MTYDILTDARAWLAERGERERTHTEDCHRWHPACLVSRLADEIERLRAWNDEAQTEASIASLVADRRRLTDRERDAIAYYIGTGGPDEVDATLRGLLERFSG